MKWFLAIAMVLALSQVANPVDKPGLQEQVTALEARVTTLEFWAVKHGGKF